MDLKPALISGAIAALVLLVAVWAWRQDRGEDTAAATAGAVPAAVTDEVETTTEERSDLLARQLDDVDREAAEFVERLPRCSALVQALELALASECVEVAYAGVEESVPRAVGAIEQLDVEAACRDVVRGYVRRLRRFHTWALATTQAGRNRQFGEFNALAVQTSRQTLRYERARARLDGCPTRGGG